MLEFFESHPLDGQARLLIQKVVPCPTPDFLALSYRRRILIQLNRGEGRHQLARVLFHGKRGELRQRYREGQEDQLGALGLVVNLVVLWNTIYMDAALDQLRAEGYEVLADDVARLSPLSFKHINMLGRYAFTLSDTVAKGELRPLRDPRTASLDEA